MKKLNVPLIAEIVDDFSEKVKETNCTNEQKNKIKLLKKTYPDRTFKGHFEALETNDWDVKRAMNYLSPYGGEEVVRRSLKKSKSYGELNAMKAADLKHWNPEYLMKNFGASKSVMRLTEEIRFGQKQKSPSPKRASLFGFKF